jgi:hypothetical protein
VHILADLLDHLKVAQKTLEFPMEYLYGEIVYNGVPV